LTETVALSGVKLAGLDYGRMRLWGSLSFIAASLVGGWIVGHYGAAAAIWLVVGGGVLTMLGAHALARPIGLGRLKAATSPPRLQFADAFGLLRSRDFVVFLLAGGAIQAAHAMFYTFGTLHWTAQGLSADWWGILWTIGVVAEIAVFMSSGALVRRFGAPGLIAIAGVAAVGRWVVMGFDPPLAWLLPLQMLHGLTFGAAHVGAIHFMAQAVPERQVGTAQALYASATGGIAMGAAMLASGPLFAAYAGKGYWAMAIIAAFGLAASVVLVSERRRRLQGQPQRSGEGGCSTAPS
jgi:MFS transporter, PPP family, 3-phenylpropionic acid transporter